MGPWHAMQHHQDAAYAQSHEAPCPHAEVGDELETSGKEVKKKKKPRKALNLVSLFLWTEQKEMRSLFCSQTE